MADFKAHDLGRLQALGRSGLSQQIGQVERFAPDARPAAAVEAPGAKGPRNKGGRPRVIEGEPWVAEGVSRRTWERRQKEGKG
jgi:hypothetical protein